MLTSTNDFLDIIQSKQNYGQLVSLDVESLFTNVPIDETINIIIEKCYFNNENKSDIPHEIMRQLLELYTKEAPFMCPNGKLCKQIESVAMGSPLSPTFANFYMGDLENIILSNNQKPYTYARYDYDIFIEITCEEELIKLREKI